MKLRSSATSRFWNRLAWVGLALIAVAIVAIFSRLELTRDQNILKSSGATVVTDDEGRPVSAWLSGPVLTDAHLEHVGRLGQLRMLTLEEGRCSPRGLAFLQSLGELRELALQDVQCDPGSLKAIGILPKLETLKISSCRWIGDDDARAISRQRQLKLLELGGTSITDSAFGSLLSLSHLELILLRNNSSLSQAGLMDFLSSRRFRNLHVSDPAIMVTLAQTGSTNRSVSFQACSVNDELLTMLPRRIPDLAAMSFRETNLANQHLGALGRCEALTSLTISGRTGTLTADGWEAIAASPLTTLSVTTGGIDDQCLEIIGGMEDLLFLQVSGPVTDGGISQLSHLHDLRTLRLNNSRVTGSTLDNLAGLAGLNRLSVYRSPMSDSGLLKTATLPSVDHLEIRYTDVTMSGVTRFRELRPDVWLSHDVDGIEAELQPVPQSDLSLETTP